MQQSQVFSRPGPYKGLVPHVESHRPSYTTYTHKKNDVIYYFIRGIIHVYYSILVKQYVSMFSGGINLTIIIFLLVSSVDFLANSLDPDQARVNVEPDLDPHCLIPEYILVINSFI